MPSSSVHTFTDPDEFSSLCGNREVSGAAIRQGTMQITVTRLMGSDRHYPEEAPAHHVTVVGFWIGRAPVANPHFLQFVNATGYMTVAEQKPETVNYRGALPHMLRAGSLVFTPPTQIANLSDWYQCVAVHVRRQLAAALRAARRERRATIRLSTSPIAMPKPTRNGRARNYRMRVRGARWP